MLEVGGLIVYSTCSLNPIENEAVMHRILKEAEGSVELMDIDLPNLKHNPGISYWTPCTKDMTPCESMKDTPEKYKSMLRPCHFPPSPEDAPKFHLEKW
jgi:tRNA (cytosine34-C5)-methyltransferase